MRRANPPIAENKLAVIKGISVFRNGIIQILRREALYCNNTNANQIKKTFYIVYRVHGKLVYLFIMYSFRIPYKKYRPNRSSAYSSTPNLKMVWETNCSPGRSTVDGKSAWFGESGKCWVSRQNPECCTKLRFPETRDPSRKLPV